MNTFTPIPVFGLTYANCLEAIYQHKAAAYEALMQREQTAAESSALMEACTADWYWLAKTVGADWQADVETARLPVELDAERHVAAWNALTAEAARAFASLEEGYEARRDGTAEEDGADIELQPCVRCGQAIAAGPVNVCEPCANGAPPVETFVPIPGGAIFGTPVDPDYRNCPKCDYRNFLPESVDAVKCFACGEFYSRPTADEPEREPSNYATEAEYYGGLLAESLAPAGRCQTCNTKLERDRHGVFCRPCSDRSAKALGLTVEDLNGVLAEPLAPAGAPLTALEANGLFDAPILDEVTYGGGAVPAIVERALPDVLAAAERLCDDVIAGISPELQAVYQRPVPTGFREARRAAIGREAIGTGRCVHGYASTVDGGSEWCAACRLERAGIAVVELTPVIIPASEVFQGADAAEFGERVDEPAPRQEKPAAHPIVAWLSEEARRVGSDLREQMTRLGY